MLIRDGMVASDEDLALVHQVLRQLSAAKDQFGHPWSDPDEPPIPLIETSVSRDHPAKAPDGITRHMQWRATETEISPRPPARRGRLNVCRGQMLPPSRAGRSTLRHVGTCCKRPRMT